MSLDDGRESSNSGSIESYDLRLIGLPVEKQNKPKKIKTFNYNSVKTAGSVKYSLHSPKVSYAFVIHVK